ncbi:PKD repeat-containing protein [Sinomicrobium oceani]|uniref:PKD repeat-containing protein n=1 Tax=Sinomicrobium oceani TaxID=1150368 RepID=A0A1K1RKI7_9FLAO|nr:PKD domain-containing protein [Sinomicrobium oceani]SFW72687.1 PKD repeat-containing protein [Sinomicrobium oceani]
MNRNSHIRTHFDSRVILSFVAILLLSGIILAFRVNESEPCKVEEIKVQASSFKVGEIITFSDYTDNAHEWKWDFGDGNEAAFRSKVVHQYKDPGKYLVSLWVNKNCNITRLVDIKPSEDIIDSTLLPKFFAPKIAYVNEPVSFSDSTSHAKSWEWRFGEGEKIDAIDRNPSYTYKTTGEKTISLFVNDDIKYVGFRKITVLPAREENTPISRADIMRETRGNVVNDFLDRVPEAPASELKEKSATTVEKSKEEVIVPELDESKLAGLIIGISEDKLSFNNFVRYFCKGKLPSVQLKDRIVSIHYLNNSIRGKKIDLKSVSIIRNKDNGCVSLIVVDYKRKGLF